MKRLMRIVLLLIVSFVLVSCKDVAVTLDTPQNVTITDGVVSWDAVTGAESYNVFVETNSYTTTDTSYDLNTLDLAVGTYQVHVVAVQGTNISLPSTTLNFVVDAVVVGVPQNVAITDGVVSWTAVTGATGYVVHVDAATYTVTTTSYDLTTLTLAQGNHTIYVVAMIGTDASANSTSVSYFVGGTTLAAPQNVVITNGVVTWSAVTGATSYVVYVGTDEYTVTVLTYDLNALNLNAGTYSVFVVAKAGTDLSAASTTVSFTIAAANLNTLYAIALASINPLYEPDMTINDFDTDYEYQDYVNTSSMVHAYCVAAVEIGMTQPEALAMFEHIATTPMRMGNMTDISGLMTEIESYSAYGMDTADLSTILYELANAAVTSHISDLGFKIADKQDQIDQAESDLIVLQTQANADLATMYNALVSYATPEELVQLQYFFTGQYEDSYKVLTTLYNIANDLKYNYGMINDPWYFHMNDDYIMMFYNILERARIANDTALLDMFLGSYPFYSLENVVNQYDMIRWQTEDRNRYQNELAIMQEIETYIGDQQTMMIDSISGVVDYLKLVYDTIPASMVTHLDDLIANGSLTMEEYIALKNEVVNVLQTTLPDTTDFANLYTTIFTVADAFGYVDSTTYLPLVNYFGGLTHAELDLSLTFVGYIQQQDVEDVMALVDGMIIPGEWVTEEWGSYYVDSSIDFAGAIDFAVYVGNYIQTFIADNQAKVDALTTLINGPETQQLVNLFGNAIKAQLEVQMDPDQYALVSMAIDEVLAKYDDFVAIGNLVGSIGSDAIDVFLSTSGQALLDLQNLMITGSGDLSDPLFVADVQAVLDQLLSYRNAFTDNLNQANIQSFLSIASIPLKVKALEDGVMTEAQFDALANQTIPVLAQFLEFGVTFAGSLDAQTLVDIATKANAMIIRGEWLTDEWGYSYYTGDSVDVPAAVDFAVYVLGYMDSFITNHQAQADALGTLFTDGTIETLLTTFANTFKTIMEPQMDPDQYAMVSLIIDEALADYDNYIAAATLVGSLGSAVVDQFLTTSGQIILDIYNLMPTTPDPTDSVFVGGVEAIFTQTLAYHDAVFDQLTLTNVETLLKLVRVPLVVQMDMSGTMTPAETNTFFNALLVPVSTVIVNFITLEQDLLANVDALDVSGMMFDSSWNITGDTALMAVAVTALDNTLTVANRGLFLITLVQIGDILKDVDVMALMGTTSTTEVDDMITSLTSQFNTLFDNIHAAAQLDFTAMDQTMIDQLVAVFQTQITLGTPTP